MTGTRVGSASGRIFGARGGLVELGEPGGVFMLDIGAKNCVETFEKLKDLEFSDAAC